MAPTHHAIPPPTQRAVLSTDVPAVQVLDCPASHNVLPQSNFLNLPAEIRNAICAYALSATYPLLYCPSHQPNTRGYLHEASQTRQFNQLKHVNRQLRAETADLEILYSEIAFEHDSSTNHTPDIFSFTRNFPARKRQWLTKVILKPPRREPSLSRDFADMFHAWRQLAIQFETYPHISFKYILPSFRSAHGEAEYPQRLMTVGILLAETVRGHYLPYLRHATIPMSIPPASYSQLQGNEAEELERRLPSFRIVPDQDAVTARWVRSAARELCKLQRSGRSLQHWILAATEWIERGI